MSLPDRPIALPELALPEARSRSFRLSPQAIPGVALLAILLAGLAASVWALTFKTAELKLDGIGWHGALRGEATAAVAKFLGAQNPFWPPLVTADRALDWSLLHDLGPKVRAGCDNWLFLMDELTLYPDRVANLAKRVRIVEGVARYLAQRNVALVVVPVPDKSRVQTAELCGVRRPAALAGRYDSIVDQLHRSGVKVVDVLRPLTALGGERYYRTDTHWNERGARGAADAIAARLREWGLGSAQHAQFRVTTEAPRERVGDLIHLALLENVSPPWRPRGDIEAASAIEQSAAPGVGLLDEAAAPDTVLVGTSFSTHANFSRFLGMALGAPIDNRAKDGGWLTGAVRAYLADPVFAKSPPRVLLWEFPERIVEETVPAADEEWAQSLATNPAR